VKAVTSSSIQLLLEWFTSTQMFEVFMTDALAGHLHGLFVMLHCLSDTQLLGGLFTHCLSDSSHL